MASPRKTTGTTRGASSCPEGNATAPRGDAALFQDSKAANCNS